MNTILVLDDEPQAVLIVIRYDSALDSPAAVAEETLRNLTSDGT